MKCKEPHICLYRDDVEIILLQANMDSIMPNRTLYGYGYDAYLSAVILLACKGKITNAGSEKFIFHSYIQKIRTFLKKSSPKKKLSSSNT